MPFAAHHADCTPALRQKTRQQNPQMGVLAAMFEIAASPDVSTAIRINLDAVQGHLTPRRGDVRKARNEPFARSGQIEAIKVHHLGPGGNKVADERRQSIITCVDFSQRTQLRV